MLSFQSGWTTEVIALGEIKTDLLANRGFLWSLDPLGQSPNVEFANHVSGDSLEAFLLVQFLEQRELFCNLEVQVGAQKIGEPADVVDIEHHDLEFVGEVPGGVDQLLK